MFSPTLRSLLAIGLLLHAPAFSPAALKIHWDLNESAGTVATDRSGGGNNGAWMGTNGSPGWMPAGGIDGGAFAFTGANLDSFIAEGFSGVSGTPFTMSLWVKTTSTENDGVGFLGVGASGSQYYVLRVSGNVARVNARNTAEVSGTGTIAVNNNQWHHLVAVYASATDRRLYVNGQLNASNTTNVAALTPTRFGIGALTRNSPYNPADLFTGLVDDAALWDRAFSPADIVALRGLVLLGAGNASDLDGLMTAFAAQGSTVIRGTSWEYASGLAGALGTTGGSIATGDAFIVLDAAGQGMGISAPAEPVVLSFDADRAAVVPGVPVTLSWRLFNADSATISGIGSVNASEGSVMVSPAVTTTYTLLATNGQGMSSAPVTVTVASGPTDPSLSEFLARNDSGITDDDGSLQDWIEIANETTFHLDLANYALTDEAAVLTKWTFPARILPPGERLLVFASGKDRRDPGLPLHANFSLNAAGEYLALVRPDGSTLVRAFAPTFPPQFANTAYGTAGDGSTGFLAPPTPGTANGPTSFEGLLSGKVIFGTAGGMFFGGTVNLTLTHPDPLATVRYTLDGSLPTLASPAYASPLAISATTLVKAAGFRANYAPGPVAQEGYVFANPALGSFSSNLPILVIDTFNTTLPRESVEFKTAVFAAFDPQAATGRSSLGDAPTENGNSGIHIRGESSQLSGFNKLNFSFETRNAEGEDKDVPLFGFPADSDWVLHASEIDRTFMRDRLPHLLFNEIGRYSSRTRPIEVFLNQDGGPITSADYRGVYILIERVKRSGDRVDVARLDPLQNAGPEVTGGYIFKKDKADPGNVNVSTAGAGNFAVTYPPEDRITSAQTSYLQTYLRAFESALNSASFTDPATGYANYTDVQSWIDFHVIQEFTKEVDSYLFSTYFYKDRGEKVSCGPLWDFDRSFGNTMAADEHLPQGWRGGAIGSRGVFWNRLFQDPDFLQLYIDRWQGLMETTLNEAHLFPIIDGMAVEVNEAKDRNFQPSGPWPLAVVTRSHLTFPTYAQHVSYLKTWIGDRLTWVKTQFTAKPAFDRAPGSVEAPFSLTLTAPAGTIYYTTNGTDPRAPGGGITGSAYTASIPIANTTTITARALVSGAWSGPLTGSFILGEPADANNLVVSEIMYHPGPPSAAAINAGFTDAELFEYLELMNIGAETIELTGVTVGLAFDFNFTGAAITQLAPGARLLLVRHAAAFEARYGAGLPVAGFYGNPGVANGGPKLDNGGERIVLTAANGGVIKDFTYDDKASWPVSPDGGGASLMLLRPTANPPHGDAGSWRSSLMGGSPGQSGTVPFAGDPGGDANGNGRSDLLDYALGTEGSLVGTTQEAFGTTPTVDGFSFYFRINPAAESVDYLVEVSANLAEWENGAGVVEYLGESTAANGAPVRNYRVLPETGRFARLRVTTAKP